jgi:hypothetical protein
MDANELLTSEILSNAEIIAAIYQIVKDAGITATKHVINDRQHHKLDILIPHVPGSNRMTTHPAYTTKYTMLYDPQHLTVVGGAALNLYDYKLKDVHTGRQFYQQSDYNKKKTADIDINWWPMVSTDSVIPISTSHAIAYLVKHFVHELEVAFQRNTDYLLDAILPYLNGVSMDDTLQIIVDYKHTRPAGVYNITIAFAIKGKILKICDINVHDGGSGQRYDREGREITDLRPMTEDPTYCIPIPHHPQSITILTIGEYTVAVPNLISVVDQQLFAFSNLVRAKQQRAFVSYKRAVCIKRALMRFQLQDIQGPNYQQLMDIFGTRDRMTLLHAMETIEEMIAQCIEKQVEPIRALCVERKQENCPDDMVEDLYRYVQRIEKRKNQELEQLKRQILEPLEKIHQQAYTERWKKETIIRFKQEFLFRVMKKIERIKEEITNETNIDTLRTYSNTRAFSELIQLNNMMKDIIQRRNEYRNNINKERQEYLRRHAVKLHH